MLYDFLWMRIDLLPNYPQKEEIDAPVFAQISRIHDSIRTILIVHHDQHTPRISKLVLMSIHPDHPPRNAVVHAQERVAILVRHQAVSDRPDAHHHARSGRGEDATEVVWERDGV